MSRTNHLLNAVFSNGLFYLLQLFLFRRVSKNLYRSCPNRNKSRGGKPCPLLSEDLTNHIPRRMNYFVVLYWFLSVVLSCWGIELLDTWVTSDSPVARWAAAATSSDGSMKVAVTDRSGIYASKDYGQTWSQLGNYTNDFQAIAMDHSGQVVVVGVNAGPIMYSTNGGQNFTRASAPTRVWFGMAMNNNGSVMYAITFNESMYLSDDVGQSWFRNTNSPYNFGYYSIACDSSGRYVVAGLQATARVTFSQDFGKTWSTSTATSSTAIYTAVAMSYDGQYMAAVAFASGIYVSSDYGASWTFTSNSQPIISIACDAYCQYIVAATSVSFLFVSFNFGSTWQRARSAGQRQWAAVVADSSGASALALVNGGSIFVGNLAPSPTSAPVLTPTRSPTSSAPPTFPPSTNILETAGDLSENLVIIIITLLAVMVVTCFLVIFVRSCNGANISRTMKVVCCGMTRSRYEPAVAEVEIIPSAASATVVVARIDEENQRTDEVPTVRSQSSLRYNRSIPQSRSISRSTASSASDVLPEAVPANSTSSAQAVAVPAYSI